MLTETPTATPHAHVVVDLAAVAHNTALFANSTRAAVMAIVKADGFGHGAPQVATTMLASGASWLGVTTCADALALRTGGITAPILSWLHGPEEDFGPALLGDIDLSVSSTDHLRSIAGAAQMLGVTANVHLKADTGLHRNGARPPEWPELARAAREQEVIGNVRVRGVWSHLISGTDPDDDSVDRQIRLYEEALEIAREAGLRPQLRHLANSWSALGNPATHYDLVRAGVGLYGVEQHPRRVFGLRGAMTLKAPLILVKRVPAGSGVSYEHDYVTERDSTLGLVPLGYADGLPWLAARRAQVWIGGRRYPVAGRIGMDQFVVDLGGDTAHTGDEVVVFGPGTDGEPTVAEWCEWAQTIPQEILIRVSPRVPRRYIHTAPGEKTNTAGGKREEPSRA
jgi:alanine racemase